MAIMACPECGKKMSSRAIMCLNCGFASGEMTKEQLDVMRKRRLREEIYRLSMISYAVMTVFVAGFGWFWWESESFQHMSSQGPLILMACAAVAYLVVRVMLFRYRQKKKALQKKTKWAD